MFKSAVHAWPLSKVTSTVNFVLPVSSVPVEANQTQVATRVSTSVVFAPVRQSALERNI